MKTFREDLRDLINKHSKESENNTADFILAAYLDNCLNNFSLIINMREQMDKGASIVNYDDGITMLILEDGICPRCSQKLETCDCNKEKT